MRKTIFKSHWHGDVWSMKIDNQIEEIREIFKSVDGGGGSGRVVPGLKLLPYGAIIHLGVELELLAFLAETDAQLTHVTEIPALALWEKRIRSLMEEEEEQFAKQLKKSGKKRAGIAAEEKSDADRFILLFKRLGKAFKKADTD